MFKESNLESPDVYICFNYTGAYDTDGLIFYFVGKIRYANEELDVAILELESNNDKILPPSIPCCINFQCGIDPGFHLIGQSYKDPNTIIEKNIQLWTKNVEVIKKAQTWSMAMFKENGYIGLDDPKKELCSCNYQLSMDGAPGIVTLRQKQEPTDLSDCQIDLHIAKGDDNLQPIHEDECAVSVELSGNERLLPCKDSRFELNIYDETDSDNEITYVKLVNAKCDDMPVESSHTNYSGHESSLVYSDDSIKCSYSLVKVESHEKIDGTEKNVEESLEEKISDCCSSIETDDMESVKESRNDKLNMSESTREEIILLREITLITKTDSSTREEITTQREIPVLAVAKTESSVTDTRDVFLDKNERRNNLKKTDEENTFSIQNEDKELISELEGSSDMSCPAVGFVCDNPLVQEHQGEVTTKESDLEMSNFMDSNNTNIHLENKLSKQFSNNYDHVEIGNNNVELEISTEKDATHEIVCDTLTTGSTEDKTVISPDTFNQSDDSIHFESDKTDILLDTFNQLETDSYNNVGISTGTFIVNSVSSKESEYSFGNHNCIEVSEVLERNDDDENEIGELSSCNFTRTLSHEHQVYNLEETIVYDPAIASEKIGFGGENEIEKLSSCISTQMLSEEHVGNKLEKTFVYEPDIVLEKIDNDDDNEIEKLSLCNSSRTLSDDHEHLGKISEEMVVYKPGVVFMLLRGYPTFYYRDGTSNEMKELVTEDKLVNTGVTMKSVFDDMKQYNIYRELCSDIFVTDIVDTVKENRRIFYDSDLPPVNL
jgi:hypothetical protein